MGDVRFERPLARIRQAKRPAEEIRLLDDEDLVQALAAAAAGAEERDPYIANVLATELLNRVRQKNTTLATAGEGVYALDRDGRVAYMNPAAERVLGRTFESLGGESMHELVHAGEDAGAPCPLLARLNRGEVVEGALSLIHISEPTRPY